MPVPPGPIRDAIQAALRKEPEAGVSAEPAFRMRRPPRPGSPGGPPLTVGGERSAAPEAPTEVLPGLRALFPSGEFSEEELQEIAPLCEIVRCEAGQVLMREGEISDQRLWFILTGAVSVVINERFILRLQRLGDLFGEMSVINEEPHSATIRTDKPSRFLVISSLHRHQPSGGNPYRFRYYFSRMFNAILADKLRLTSQKAKLFEDAVMQVQRAERQTVTLEDQVARNLQQIRLFSHLVDSAHDTIILTDTEGKITQANASLERSFGIAPAKVVGWQAGRLLGLPAVGPGSWQEVTRLAAAQGWQREVEVLGNRETGAIPAECTISEVTDQNRERLAYAVILRDNRARRAYEARILAQSEDLARANRDLREIDRLKTSFLSLVSHELRTPISSILAYAEALTTEGMVAQDDREGFIQTIHKEAGRLRDLVNKVLAMSKLESGQMLFAFHQQSLAAHLELAVSMVRESAEAQGLVLTLDIPPIPIAANFDSERILDVMHHVLENALHHTKHGGIHVTLAQNDRESTITVVDTGTGIAADLLPRVFDKFARADHPNLPQQGLGLGLPLCYHIVKAHGGSIRIESPPGQGTSHQAQGTAVIIHLPYHPPAA